MVQVRFYLLCTKQIAHRAHVTSPPRPSVFQHVALKNWNGPGDEATSFIETLLLENKM